MAVILLKGPDFNIAAVETATDFEMALRHIIRMAYFVCGIEMVYSEDARDLLHSIVLNMQAEEIFLWTVEEYLQAFTAPSKVLGDVDGETYTCYIGNTATALNRPDSGANSPRNWYKAGSGGSAYVVGSTYISTGDFYLDADTLDIEQVIIRFNNADNELTKMSRMEYERVSVKQETGMPEKFYFEQGTDPRIFFFPQVHEDSVDDYLAVIKKIRRLRDLQIGTALNFFKYWYTPLYYLLASKLAIIPTNNVPLEHAMMIKNESEQSWRKAVKLNRGGNQNHRLARG